MTTSKIPTGRFVWFEYLSGDAAKAQGFFGELFNWGTHDVPMPQGKYQMIALGGDSKQTIGGYLPTPKGAPPHAHWLAHLQVADAAATVAQVRAHGGTVPAEPWKLGEVGTMAVVKDPLGGVFALWQPSQVIGTGDYKGVAGAFCWNELYTEQPDQSAAFYAAIGGFEHGKMEMGPDMGTYHLLSSEGKSRAGMMKPPMPGIPQHWMPYVQVADVDATIAKAKKLGADIKLAAASAPGVGKFGVLLDPQGASLGVLQPEGK
jgi:hypothetical protein